MAFAGKANQVMLQGVHELYELNEMPQIWEENQRINRLVFIGEETQITLYTIPTPRSSAGAQIVASPSLFSG